MQHRSARVLILSILMSIVSGPVFAAPPEIFSSLNLEDARKKAVDEGRWLVVKATAVWCGPCKKMDKTTWVDESVIAWFDEKGIAIQVDVDQSRATAQMLKIQAMPTMIAFRDGEEFDRIVGYKGPDEFHEWLEGIERGEHAIDRVEAAAREDGSVDARYELAGALMQNGRYDEAVEQYIWLWENIPTKAPHMSGVRGSFMAGDMERLALAHAPARERLVALRDSVTEGERDWITLNGIVGEPERTLTWFDRVKDDPSAAGVIRGSTRDLHQLLEAEGRWADMGALYARPTEDIRRTLEIRTITRSLDQGGAEMQAIQDRLFRDECGRMFASLLAADRDDEARTVAAAILEADGSDDMRAAMVNWAGRAGEPAEHARSFMTATPERAPESAPDRVAILEERMDEMAQRLERIERQLATLLGRTRDGDS